MCSSPPETAGALHHASSHPARGKKRGGSRRSCRRLKVERCTVGASRSSSRSSRTRRSSGAVTRFLRRGLAACQAEWQLIAATHNLLKLWRAGLAYAQAITAEPLAA